MAAVVFLTLAFLICKAQSQIYGPGPIYPGPRIDPGPCGPTAEFNAPFFLDPYGTPTVPNIGSISQPSLSYNQPLNIPSQPCYQNPIPTYSSIINQPCKSIPAITQQLIPNALQQLTPSVVTNPVPQCAATPPVVTTIVDNTLANSLANAIQLLIVSNLIENTLGSSSVCGNSLAQSLGLLDSPCINNYEVVMPDIVPSAPVVTCEYSNLYGNDFPSYQESVVCQSPCTEAPCASNFGPGYGSSFSVLRDSNSFGFNNCGSNPMFGIDTCSNLFGSPATSSFVCAEPMVASVAPMAVEVPFPASIPAQLRCNFGYLPTNVPCVSVNVEPLPFDSCQNFYGNLGSINY